MGPPAKASPAGAGVSKVHGVFEERGTLDFSQLAPPFLFPSQQAVLRFHGEGTGFESSNLGSNPASTPYSLFILLQSLCLSFLICEMGITLPDPQGGGMTNAK